jgi:CopG family nickel-responsive transcriptional regulator
MQRVTISLEPSLAREFDRHIKARRYQNRSEAVRDLVREAVGERRVEGLPKAPCIANLSYVYDHGVRSLARRLMSMQHAHHDIVISNTRVHLDHEHCIETLILKGTVREVQDLADALRAERGVRFGSLNLIVVERNDRHERGRAHHHLGHVHLSPLRG